MVAVKEAGEKYRCNVCGNEVEVTKVGGGELVCGGQPMQLITEAAPAPETPAPEAEEAPSEAPSEESAPEEPAPAPSEGEKPTTF